MGDFTVPACGLLGVAATIGGCASSESASHPETAPAVQAAEAAGAPEAGLVPFVQEIEDTAMSFEMVPVPAGTVTVQTDTGPQEVEVGPFWILPTETTWDLYDTYHLRQDRRRSLEGTMADAVTRPSKPYAPADRGFGHGGYAALSMTHHAAKAFCTWLSFKTGKTYRLPTEAEWQWVCELGGVAPETIDQHAWHKGNAERKTHPVASKQPDELGLYDLYGNATEWCTGLDGEPITLGGSYLDPPEMLGCAARFPQTPEWNESDPQFPKSRWWFADASWVGFRFVCIPNQDAE